MTSPGQMRQATLDASTKRFPDVDTSTGLEGDEYYFLRGLKMTPLQPVDAEIAARAGLDTPHKIFQTFIFGEYDIQPGDLLEDESVTPVIEYPIRAVWKYDHQRIKYRQLLVEELRKGG